MGLFGGVFRLRFLLQLVTLALLALCAIYAFNVVGIAPGSATRSPFQAAPSAAGSYSLEKIASFRYGTAATDLGLRAGPERQTVGPVSFTVESGGRFAVADAVNGRIQIYSADGKHERAIPRQGPVHDLAVSSTGSLYALGIDATVTSYDIATGKQSASWSVRPDLAKSLGQLRAIGSSVSLETPDQRTVPVMSAGAALSTLSQETGQATGLATGSGVSYATAYRDQGHLYRLDSQGNVILDIALNLPNVASVIFLGEDRAGALYVQVERFEAKNQISVEVRQFNREGGLAATISVPPVTYLEMTRSILVTDAGDIYELLPDQAGVTLLRWRKQ